MTERTNHPGKNLGPMPFRKMPILSLAFIQRQERFAHEIDLSALPPLISGGDRKARSKAIAEQQSGLRTPRRVARNPWQAAYGALAVTCSHCRHCMLLDQEFDETILDMLCDRCHRTV